MYFFGDIKCFVQIVYRFLNFKEQKLLKKLKCLLQDVNTFS